MDPGTREICLAGSVPPRIRPALSMLLEAHCYARQTGSDTWEFAVEIDQLAAIGLLRNDLRWLVRKEFVEHRREVTLEGENGRAFSFTGDLTFTERTCFVLTEWGCQFVGEACEQSNCSTKSSYFEPVHSDGHPIESMDGLPTGKNDGQTDADLKPPRWDAQKRVLCVNGRLVKRYKWSAANQEAILAAFEEEGWPPRIDDPLSPHPDQDSKRRLSDAIKCLNRKQANPLLHFRGDGSGEGVLWEFTRRGESEVCPLRP